LAFLLLSPPASSWVASSSYRKKAELCFFLFSAQGKNGSEVEENETNEEVIWFPLTR
jgi:hypothetical protein